MNATHRRHGASLRRERISELLADAGLHTKTAQARHLGMHRATWIALMSGRALPSLPAALRMADRLGTTVNDIAVLDKQAA